MAEPKYDGNVGSIARAMKNFGLSDLVLVNPCEIGDDARKRAMHANDILDNVKTFKTLSGAAKGVDFLVGTSGVVNLNEKQHIRNPMSPREFAQRMKSQSGRVGIVFGREDFGLFKEELELCDMLITIPTSQEYPIMNLSHAACTVFYELFQTSKEAIELLPRPKKATNFEKEKLYEHFDYLMEATNYPPFKREKTAITFRRLMGRALPSTWEFHIVMGVISRAVKSIERKKAAKSAAARPKTGRKRKV